MKASRAPRGKHTKRKSNSNKPHDLASLITREATLISAVGLVIVVVLVYANSLGNDFVFDDTYLIVQNPQIKSLNIFALLNSYRPFRDITYAIDFAIWGAGPFGFHLTNILLHAANVLLVFSLIRRFTDNLITSLIAAVIFAVHPLQTDSVTYISGRRDLLFSFFYLLGFLAYLKYYRTRWSIKSAVYLFLFLVCWACGLMSKEMAVTLPLLIFVWHFCNSWEPEQRWWRAMVPSLRKTFLADKWLWLGLFLAGIAVTIYAALFTSASERARNLEYWGGSVYLNFLTVIRVHAWYLKQLIFPTPIAQYLGAFDISRSVDWSFIVAAVVVGGVLAGALTLLNRRKLMAFAILSYFVLLLPVSQIIPHHELLADHYLYLPLMSFGLFVSLLVKEITAVSKTSARIAYAAVTLGVLVLAVITVVHNRTWKDERTLWSTNYQAVPNSPRAALNLGNTYQDTEPQRAEQLFKRALELQPTPTIKRTLYDRLAVILIQQGKYDEASYFVAEVLNNNPNDFYGILWASQIHMFKKECVQARNKLSAALAAASKPQETVLVQETRKEMDRRCQ